MNRDLTVLPDCSPKPCRFRAFPVPSHDVPLEKIVVNTPGVGPQVIDVEVRPDEGDDDIAKRLARSFPLGTLLSVSGAKWRVTSNDPPKVIEEGVQAPPRANPEVGYDQNGVWNTGPLGIEEPSTTSVGGELVLQPGAGVPPREPVLVSVPPVLAKLPKLQHGPQPGEQWRPKDPRRKSGFTIKAVTETEVIAEDGRTVSLDRMRRYEKIG